MRMVFVSSVLLVVLAACASGPTQLGFEQMLQTWRGADVNRLISHWGPPTRVDVLPDGNKMYTFTRSRSYEQAAYVAPTYRTPGTTTVTVRGNSATATSTPGHVYGGEEYGSRTVTDFCSVSFTANAAQRVVTWRYEGNLCRAHERKHS